MPHPPSQLVHSETKTILKYIINNSEIMAVQSKGLLARGWSYEELGGVLRGMGLPRLVVRRTIIE